MFSALTTKNAEVYLQANGILRRKENNYELKRVELVREFKAAKVAKVPSCRLRRASSKAACSDQLLRRQVGQQDKNSHWRRGRDVRDVGRGVH